MASDKVSLTTNGLFTPPPESGNSCPFRLKVDVNAADGGVRFTLSQQEDADLSRLEMLKLYLIEKSPDAKC